MVKCSGVLPGRVCRDLVRNLLENTESMSEGLSAVQADAKSRPLAFRQRVLTLLEDSPLADFDVTPLTAGREQGDQLLTVVLVWIFWASF
jgi:hypothetical protein